MLKSARMIWGWNRFGNCYTSLKAEGNLNENWNFKRKNKQKILYASLRGVFNGLFGLAKCCNVLLKRDWWESRSGRAEESHRNTFLSFNYRKNTFSLIKAHFSAFHARSGEIAIIFNYLLLVITAWSSRRSVVRNIVNLPSRSWVNSCWDLGGKGWTIVELEERT